MKIKKRIRIIVGICFLVAGVCYFFYPDFREWKTQKNVDHIINEFEKDKSAEKNSGDDLKKTVLPDLYSALEKYNEDLIISGQQITDAWSYEQLPVDVNLLDKENPVIGYIEIPDIQLRLPLYLGASTDNLAKGAAVLSQTSMPIGGENTNCVIAGHRGYRGEAYFHYINELQIGAKVYVTNPWETLTYQVTGTKIVMPDQVDEVMIQNGKDMVTLVSCHPYAVKVGKKRYLVYCERVQSEQKDGIKESENNSELKNENEESKENQENQLQEWERILRIVVPIGIVLLSCLMIYRKKR